MGSRLFVCKPSSHSLFPDLFICVSNSLFSKVQFILVQHLLDLSWRNLRTRALGLLAEKGLSGTFVLSFLCSLFLIVNLKDHSDHSMKLGLVGDYLTPTNGTLSVFPPGTQWKSLNQGRHVQAEAVEARPAVLLPSPSLVSNISTNWNIQLERRRMRNDLPSSFTQKVLRRSHIRNVTRIGALPKIVKKTGPRLHRGRKYFSYFCRTPLFVLTSYHDA